MNAEFEDFGTGWIQVFLSMKENDIDSLIEMLKLLKANPDSHFHLASDYEGESGVGDIEISFQGEDQKDNMQFTSMPIEPTR
ncbi:MAG: hypothetical protein KZQ97_22225 [Candidatus Thiodiazotropha sp. (ex Dulcina madagascariensis)]|nr:hypothetical protein [Candidatus Thiodiazotropha sp. (ex Dulcina madagascariensis)]